LAFIILCMDRKKVLDRNTIIKIIIGSLIGGGAIYLALQGVSINRLGQVLGEVHPVLVLSSLVIVLLNVGILALRWWVMMLFNWQPSTYFSLLWAVYLGQMFNILIPARLGELARVYFAGEKIEGTSKSRLFGSVVLEKVIDVIIFAGALLLLILALSLPDWIADPGMTLVWLAAAGLVGVVILTIWGRPILSWMSPLLKRLPYSWGERLAGILARALSGFESMRDWRRQLPIWFLSLFSLFLSAATNYILLRALGISAPFTAALFVLIVLQVGSAPPSAPGKLGVFHYLVVLALSAFNIEKGIAVAYSVLLYVVVLFPKVVIGALIMMLSRWRLPALNLVGNHKWRA